MSEEMKIRSLDFSDLPTRVAWINDSRINSTLNIRVPVDLEGTKAWFARVRENPTRRDFAFEEDGKLVAMGGFTDIEPEVKKAELYIFVDPARKGQGIGTRAVQRMCAFAFDSLGLEKVYLHVNADNAAARRVYEKCAFKMEGLMRREIINNGSLKDRCFYATYPPPFRSLVGRENSTSGNSSAAKKCKLEGDL